jgi:hypothetical protein
MESGTQALNSTKLKVERYQNIKTISLQVMILNNGNSRHLKSRMSLPSVKFDEATSAGMK